MKNAALKNGTPLFPNENRLSEAGEHGPRVADATLGRKRHRYLPVNSMAPSGNR